MYNRFRFIESFYYTKLSTFQKYDDESKASVALDFYISPFDGVGSVCSSRLDAFSTLKTTTSKLETAG